MNLLRPVVLALALCAAASAQLRPVQVRHIHLRKGEAGELQFGESSVKFIETGKRRKHSAEWKYGDIQQLVLRPDGLRIRTYDDVRRQLGRDREYDFDSMAKERVPEIYKYLRTRMDRRFVAAIAEPVDAPLWRVNAKLLEGLGGSQGAVVVGENRIVYQSERPGEARTWDISDIDNVSSSGPFDLTFTTFERSASADRKSTRLNSSHSEISRMPSSA